MQPHARIMMRTSRQLFKRPRAILGFSVTAQRSSGGVTWSSVLHVAGEQRPAHALSIFVRAASRWEILSLQNMALLSPRIGAPQPS
jgi:hypothetical protein